MVSRPIAMRALTSVLLTCLISLMLSSGLAAQAAERNIRAVVRVLPPFVEQTDGKYSGFSIELWDEIAKRRHWDTEIAVAPNVQGQLDAVSAGKADVGVGAISVTAERSLNFDFSQPILNSGLQILVRSQPGARHTGVLENLLSLLFSPAVLEWLGIAILLTIIPAHIVWFMERGNPDGMVASKRYFPGIFEAFFWGLGTLATQADSMPRHWFSRIMAVLWMFTSVVFVAYYTATLTANLTVQRIKSDINGPDDLAGKTVATVAKTTSVEYLKDKGVNLVTFNDLDGAYKALTDVQVSAVVYDAPVLQYIASHKGSGQTMTVGPVFHNEDYGFLFANGSALRREVDTTLLELREDGTYAKLSEKWFGK